MGFPDFHQTDNFLELQALNFRPCYSLTGSHFEPPPFPYLVSSICQGLLLRCICWLGLLWGEVRMNACGVPAMYSEADRQKFYSCCLVAKSYMTVL